jgi:hypothetical protein
MQKDGARLRDSFSYQPTVRRRQIVYFTMPENPPDRLLKFASETGRSAIIYRKPRKPMIQPALRRRVKRLGLRVIRSAVRVDNRRIGRIAVGRRQPCLNLRPAARYKFY